MPSLATDLTRDEQEHVRVALRGLCLRAGTQRAVYTALDMDKSVVAKILRGGAVTASMAFRVARLLKTPIGDLIGGRYRPPGPCPYCGRSND